MKYNRSGLKRQIIQYITHIALSAFAANSLAPTLSYAQFGCAEDKKKEKSVTVQDAPELTDTAYEKLKANIVDDRDTTRVNSKPVQKAKGISLKPQTKHSDYSMTIDNSNPNNSALLTMTTMHSIAYGKSNGCEVLDFNTYRFNVGIKGRDTTLTASSPSELEAQLEGLGLTNAHAYFGPMPTRKLGDQVGRFLSDGDGKKFTGGNQQWQQNHARAAQSLENSTGYLVLAKTDQTGASLGFYVDKDLVTRCSENETTSQTPIIQQSPTQATKEEKTVDKQIALERASVEFNDNCNKKGSSAWKWVAGIGIGLGVGYLIYRATDNGGITIINTNINNNDGNDLPDGWGHEEDDDHDGVNGPRP